MHAIQTHIGEPIKGFFRENEKSTRAALYTTLAVAFVASAFFITFSVLIVAAPGLTIGALTIGAAGAAIGGLPVTIAIAVVAGSAGIGLSILIIKHPSTSSPDRSLSSSLDEDLVFTGPPTTKQQWVADSINWLRSDELKHGIEDDAATTNLRRQAGDYLLGIHHKINKGEDAPIPFYYHATEEKHLFPILNSGKIKRSDAFNGNGAYFSTANEYLSYGPYTLAFDKSTIDHMSGTYFQSKTMQAMNFCIDQDDVAFTPNNLACIIAYKDDLENLSSIVNSTSFSEVTILDRQVANIVSLALHHNDPQANQHFQGKGKLWERNMGDLIGKERPENFADFPS